MSIIPLKHVTWGQALGLAVKRLRGLTGMSQEKMAYSLGMSRSHVYRLEKGEISPQFDTLVTLAEFLGLTPDELVREIRRQHDRLKRKR